MTKDADRLTPSDRLGFLSATGALFAGLALLGVVAWTLLAGPALFSPGSLSAVSRGRPQGGVSSHTQIRDCGACHAVPWSGQTMAARCLACHANVGVQIRARSGLHGRLVGERSSPTCRGCHTDHHGAKGSQTVMGSAFPHFLTGYSLSGHQRTPRGTKVTCSDCHHKDLAHFDETSCSECHSSLDAGFMRKHIAAFGAQCLTCHDGSGRFGADFDHSKLPFKLTGKHTNLACVRCHPDTGSIQALKATPTECWGCHAKDDKHNGSFGRSCGQCHSTDRWTGAKFDHAIFPVNHGSRERVATCQTCHPTTLSSYTCLGCHEHTPAGIVSDHEGRSLAQLANCIRCHPGGTKGGD